MDVQVTINSTDLLALKNDLLDADQWVQEAVTGKINACRKRMLNEWVPKLLADPDVASLPATEDEIIALIVARPDYLDRFAREAKAAEEAAARAAATAGGE